MAQDEIPFRRLALITGSVAGSMLALELLMSKLLPFFLGNISSFWAIPVAMLGLSLGALVRHFAKRDFGASDLPWLTWALWIAAFAALASCFGIFNTFFDITVNRQQNPIDDVGKTLLLSGLFLPPFALAGLTLASCFAAAGRKVGSLYGVDLASSALGCVMTPLILAQFSLPAALCSLLGTLGVALIAASRTRARAAGIWAVAYAVVIGLASQGTIFLEKPDLAVWLQRFARGQPVREVRHSWDHISRVGLIEAGGEELPPERRRYLVIHDDAISNVGVRPYQPERVDAERRIAYGYGIPQLLDQMPENILVMFAGVGRDMIGLHAATGGEASVTGVEISKLVPWVVTGEPEWDHWRLREFYDLPNVHHVTAEGRSFLDSSDEQFDFMFAASNGAQYAARAGHVRRFLDTQEALEAYLDNLTEDGVLVFNRQPIDYKVEQFERIFRERGLGGIEDKIIVGRHREDREPRLLIVKPSGFSTSEVSRIRGHYAREDAVLYYTPAHGPERLAEVHVSDPDGFVPTDNRPYQAPVTLKDFTLFPSDTQLWNLAYSLNWVKLMTLALSFVITGALSAVYLTRSRGGARLPVGWGGYFLWTGSMYMLTQIGLMAKLELFLGRPLLSIAVILASYLLCNGLGSTLVTRFDQQGRRPQVWQVAVAAAAAAGLTLGISEALLGLGLLGLPLPIKIILCVIAVTPLATTLGMFFPLGAMAQGDAGRPQLVPACFGMATLSSVFGGTLAILLAINLGFRALVMLAIGGYLLLALTLRATGVGTPARG